MHSHLINFVVCNNFCYCKQTQMALRVRMQGDKQVIEGEIADLKFYLCEFNPARRNATKHFIIQPCTISLHGNTPEAKGMNISLSTSDIRINVSPGMHLFTIFF